MGIEEQYFEYLKTVNPIAQKIGEDIENIRESHKEHWHSLDVKAKERLVDDALIDLNLIQKYESTPGEDMEDTFGPGSTFSWFTKSQLNLFTLISLKAERGKTPMRKTDVLSPIKKTKTAPAPPPPGKAHKARPSNEDTSKGKPSKVDPPKTKPSKEDRPAEKTKGVAKPKTPPPPPPSKLVPAERKGLLDESLGEDIPKTGFDFLDNW